MADRWQIFKNDGSVLGPLSPLEVRDALRDGSIDPFDLVCRVGSKVKQPLVEVDEIFSSAEEAEKGKVDSVYDQPNINMASDLGETVATDIRKVVDGSADSGFSPNLSQPQDFNPGSARKPRGGSKKHAKKYYLVDKKRRFHGPLSAPEIQSLFFRGLVQPGTTVSKDRGSTRIPVQQFVTAYMGAKAKKQNDEPTKFNFDILAEKKGLPNSKDMDQWARTVAHEAAIAGPGFPYGIAAMIVAAVFVLYFIVQYALIPRLKVMRQVEQPVAQQQIPPEGIEIEPGPEIEPIRPTVKKLVETPRPSPKAKAPAKKKKKSASARKTASSRLPRNHWKVPPRTYNRASTSRLKPMAPAKPSPATLPAGYAARSGQVINIANVSYSLAALKGCGLKCTLVARDSKGVTLNVVFFKGQYEEVLRRKGGRASLSGRIDVRGNVNVLYLQAVR